MTNSASAPKRASGRPFFGWYVVGSAFVSFLIAFGYIYAFGVFAPSLIASFGLNQAAVSLLFSISYTLYLLCGVATGQLADAVGPRPVVFAGGVLLGLGLILASLSRSSIMLYATFGLGMGLGLACIYVPATEVVEHWFVRRRGYASGITVAGLGVGNLIVPPAAAALVAWIGWRATFATLGAIALITIPAMAMLLVRSPELLGQNPDGDAQSNPAERDLETSGLTLRQATRMRPFWLVYTAVLFASLALFLPFAHLALYARGYGASAEGASIVVGMIGAGTLVSRLLAGGYTDRFPPRLLLAATFAGTALSMLFWLEARNVFTLGIFAFVFGICYGTNSAILPALTVDYFGEKHSGEIIGLLFTAAVPGSLLGPTLAGEVFDVYGSYNLAILASIAVFLVALVCVLLSTDPTPTPPRIAPAGNPGRRINGSGRSGR